MNLIVLQLLQSPSLQEFYNLNAFLLFSYGHLIDIISFHFDVDADRSASFANFNIFGASSNGNFQMALSQSALSFPFVELNFHLLEFIELMKF